MAFFPRYLKRFTSSDGSTYTYTFPTRLYSLSMQQPIRMSQVVIAGASHAFDQLGTGVAPKNGPLATHSVVIAESTGTAVDDEYDDMRSKLYKAGLGKLYVADEGDDERWAWARLAAMPTTDWTLGDHSTLAVQLQWAIISDWHSETAYNQTFTIDASPKTVSVVNPGNARVYDAVLILKGTYTNPSILNDLNDYQISTTRDGSNAAHWLEIRAGRPSVRFSTDSGVTYTGDFALVTLPTNQIQLMVLEPGAQDIIVTGGNGSTLTVQFDPPWE